MARKKLANSIPRVGLVGEWLLDGNRNDTNDGTKNDGTATNVTYITTTIGYQKQAGKATSGKILGTNPISDTQAQTGFSISLKFKMDTFVSNGHFFGFTTTNGSVYRNLSFRCITRTTNNWEIYGTLSTSGAYITLTSSIDNNWHDFVVTYNGSSISMYLDGSLVSTTSATLNTTSGNNQKISILSDIHGTGNGSNTIQGMRMYNKILSQQEIQNLYQEGLRQLRAGRDNILSSAVAQFKPMDGDTILSDIIGGTIATYIGGISTTDSFGITGAIINPNYTWSSITYTTGYTFENSGSGWGIVTSPSGLSATGIDRTTTLRDIFLMNRTLSTDEVAELQRLCLIRYLYPFKKTFPLSLKDGNVLHLALDNSTTTLYDLSGNGDATISSTPTIKRQGQHKYISLSSQSISWSSRTIGTSLCWEKVSGKWELQVNPDYITSTGISSTTKDLANIYITTRTLSINEIQTFKYSTFII